MTVTRLSLTADRSVDSWRNLPAAQQPDWPDPVALRSVLDELRNAPPLVCAAECNQLRARLAAVVRGNAFLLQGGDCVETFNAVSPAQVRGTLQTLSQMAMIIGCASALPVVKVGRLAGQYAKPRSSPTETRGGITLPSYRGDAVNGLEFSREARIPDPYRLLRTYQASMATLNTVRAHSGGVRLDLPQLRADNRDAVLASPLAQRYPPVCADSDAALGFGWSLGVAPEGVGQSEFFTSHEALILGYENALTRRDGRSGRTYDLSSHMIWIGERTRQLDGAHVEFASRVANPVGVKLSSRVSPDDVLALVDRLDPHGQPGRLTLIIRMGARRVRDRLPELVERVTASCAPVVWLCDPMHGNTFDGPGGRKTRRFEDVLDEVHGFLEVHWQLGTHPGGLHLELTGEDVTECLGGSAKIGVDDLSRRYRTACDPRFNRQQALDLAFRVAELYRDRVTAPQLRSLDDKIG
jgi:3-deoxy-7-phosphoheptulonate synthase